MDPATTDGARSGRDPPGYGDSVTFTHRRSCRRRHGHDRVQSDGTTIPGCGSEALDAGVATCTTDTLDAGTHAITADYSGSDSYTAAARRRSDQTVDARDEHALPDLNPRPSATPYRHRDGDRRPTARSDRLGPVHDRRVDVGGPVTLAAGPLRSRSPTSTRGPQSQLDLLRKRTTPGAPTRRRRPSAAHLDGRRRTSTSSDYGDAVTSSDRCRRGVAAPVQFSIDGRLRLVAVGASGEARSDSISSLGAGDHDIAATFSAPPLRRQHRHAHRTVARRHHDQRRFRRQPVAVRRRRHLHGNGYAGTGKWHRPGDRRLTRGAPVALRWRSDPGRSQPQRRRPPGRCGVPRQRELQVELRQRGADGQQAFERHGAREHTVGAAGWLFGHVPGNDHGWRPGPRWDRAVLRRRIAHGQPRHALGNGHRVPDDHGTERRGAHDHGGLLRSPHLTSTATATMTVAADHSPPPAGREDGYWMVGSAARCTRLRRSVQGRHERGRCRRHRADEVRPGLLGPHHNGTLLRFATPNLATHTNCEPASAVSVSATPTNNGYRIFTDIGRALRSGRSPW